MSGSSIYLTGSTIEPVNEVTGMVEPDWRGVAVSKLQHYGLKVINPLQLAWVAHDADEFNSNIRRSLDLIDQCDALLANLAKPSYGTAMELFYAHRHGKLVTVVGNSPFNPWVLSHSQARFTDIDRALDYLIDEQPRFDPIAWALQYEGVLAQKYEQFPQAGEPDYQFFGGEIPVLVLAPHATAYFRDGEFHEADSFSGSLAVLLNKMAHCHVLKSNYCCVADPCWHLETPMHRALVDVVKAGQIGLMIMLFAQEGHESPGIELNALGPSKATCDQLLERLHNKLSTLEAVGLQDTITSMPLTNFVAKDLAVPIITIKIHKRYRMPRLQPALFIKITHILKEFIEETGIELLRSVS